MSYRITISDNRKYIRVKVSVDIDADLAGELTRQSTGVRSDTGISRYLFDVRGVRNIESILDSYDFAYKDSRVIDLSRKSRAAILTSAGDNSHEFAITALMNAGFQVRGFVGEDEAIAWLEQD